MTPAQREQLNRFLAVKVLGWTVTPYHCFPPGLPPEANVAHYRLPKFESLGDCEPLLDKIEQDGWHWNLRYFGELVGYECDLWRDIINGPIFPHTHKTRTEPLCLAIARAYGWKE